MKSGTITVGQSPLTVSGLGVRPGTPDYEQVMLNHKQQVQRYYGTTNKKS